MNAFSFLSLLPPDPILGLTAAFKADPRKEKINLGVGAYQTDQGKSWVLPSVEKAEQLVLAQNLDKQYLPITGDAAFVTLFAKLVMDTIPEHFFGMQTVAGTGALRLAIDLLQRANLTPLRLSSPTWPNHTGICNRINFPIQPYRYYSAKGVDFSGMVEDLEKQEGGSILLQASCHNPTGFDLTEQQWRDLSEVCQRQKIFPLFDIAYQGFGEGLQEDARAIRIFVEQGHNLLFTASCSKIFGLYGERVGMLGAVCQSAEQAAVIGSHLKNIARASYSTPPLHGARIVKTILADKGLQKEWEQDLQVMRERIQKMRSFLITSLQNKGLKERFAPVEQQKGMFSYTGLHEEEVKNLTEKFGIYMPKSGRINVAGLTENNLSYVVDALAEVVQSHAAS